MAYLGNSPANALFNLTPPITLVAGQTVVNINYTPGRTLFMLNGAELVPGQDITATNGSSVTLAQGANANDVFWAVNFASFNVANALPLAGGVMGGPVTLAGGDTGVTPAQFDNSQKLATSAFVKSALGGLSGFTPVNASQALTIAQLGSHVQISGAAANSQIFTLPDFTGLPSGVGYWITNNSSYSQIIKAYGSQNIYAVGANNTLVLQPAETVFIFLQATAQWCVFGAIAAFNFGSSLASPGYQKLPSGLITQWGAVTATTSGAPVAYPVSFPSAALAVLITATAATPVTASAASGSQSGFTAYATATVGANWIAIGK